MTDLSGLEGCRPSGAARWLLVALRRTSLRDRSLGTTSPRPMPPRLSLGDALATLTSRFVDAILRAVAQAHDGGERGAPRKEASADRRLGRAALRILLEWGTPMDLATIADHL